MCRKIRCDEKSLKLFGFRSELNKAKGTQVSSYPDNTADAHTLHSGQLALESLAVSALESFYGILKTTFFQESADVTYGHI
jgi:hypothetical protein